MRQPIIINTLGGSGDGLGIKRDEETVTKIDSNPRSRAPVYEPISLQNEADYFLSSAASKNDDGTLTFLLRVEVLLSVRVNGILKCSY